MGKIQYNDQFERIDYDEEVAASLQNKGFRRIFDKLEGKELNNKELSSSLQRRVVDSERDDFDGYLKSYMISPLIKSQLDTLTLLANTGRGKNFGDGYSFFPDITGATTPFCLTFEIAGHRHSDGMAHFTDKVAMAGQPLVLEAEQNNPYDEHAIQILLNGVCIGHVPKGLNKGLLTFINDRHPLEASIARVNGTAERPNLMVLAKIN